MNRFSYLAEIKGNGWWPGEHNKFKSRKKRLKDQLLRELSSNVRYS